MVKGTYRIGGMNIEIDSQFENVHFFFERFRTNEKAEVTFSMTEEDIRKETEWRKRRWEKKTEPDPCSGKALTEILAIHRKICEYAPMRDTFLIHGSSISADQEGYIFTAVSGTGKSTHTGLWRKMLGNRAVMVDDDKPMIHVEPDGEASVNGTPWNGKHHLGEPITVPLKAICLLERSRENRIQEITLFEAMPKLMQQIYRPMNAEAMKRMMACITRMRVRYYRLGCNMEIQAARLSFETMSGRSADKTED